LIIQGDNFDLDGLAEIQIERPTQESHKFSVAEAIRSFLADFRLFFNK
jgi:hypothetical protein